MSGQESEIRTDEELLVAHLDGDVRAFPELMDRYKNELLHFLIRFVGSKAAAEDVFQETFLQIHISGATFDPKRRFKPWLFTIAAFSSKAKNYLSKRNFKIIIVGLSIVLIYFGIEFLFKL